MPDRKNTDLVARDHKSVQGDVSGVAVRDDQFAQVPLDAPSYERVRGEVIDRGLDRRHCIQCGIWVFVAQEREGTLDVIESTLRIDYRCHGFGRCARPSTARRCIQA